MNYKYRISSDMLIGECLCRSPLFLRFGLFLRLPKIILRGDILFSVPPPDDALDEFLIPDGVRDQLVLLLLELLHFLEVQLFFLFNLG